MTTKATARHQGAGGSPASEGTVTAAGLTLEALLYIVIAVTAALLRLWSLDAWPLRVGEAAQALGAWHLAHGLPGGTEAYSPILMTGNLILFWMSLASDAAARFLPALCGVGLALTPALLRGRLGRIGALAASVCLTISPSLLFAGRSLDGRIVAVTAGVVLISALVRLVDDGDRRSLFLAALGLALGLLSAPLFYSVLLILLLGCLILWSARERIGWETLVGRLPDAWRGWRADARLWQTLGVSLLAALILAGTGFFANLDGLGMAAGLLPAWGRGFAWAGRTLSPLMPVWALLIYEAPLLLFGIAGLIAGWKRREPLAILLGWWVLAGLILSLVSGGWQPTDLILIATPLALLAGAFLGDLLESAGRETLVDGEWILLGLSVPLAVYGYIMFANFGASGQSAQLIFALVFPLALYVVGIVLIGLWLGWGRALRSAALALAAFGAALLISVGWGSSHNPDFMRHDLLAVQRVGPGVRDLVGTMERYSSQSAGDSHSAPVLVVGESLRWLEWSLRDFRTVTFVDSFGAIGDAQIVLSPAGIEPPLGETFSGQDLALASSWSPTELKGRPLVKWLLFRAPPGSVERENVILWVKRAQPE